MAVSVGQAEAAVYNYGVSYDSTTLYDVTVITQDDDGGLSDYYFDSLNAEGPDFQLPLQTPGLRSAKVYRLRVVTDGTDVVSCELAGFDCGVSKDDYYSFQESPLSFSDEYRQLAFSEPAAIGVSFSFSDWNGQASSGVSFSGEGYYGWADFRETKFTVVDMAPVPLPATAALLPMGLGALALVRRRRPKAS